MLLLFAGIGGEELFCSIPTMSPLRTGDGGFSSVSLDEDMHELSEFNEQYKSNLKGGGDGAHGRDGASGGDGTLPPRGGNSLLKKSKLINANGGAGAAGAAKPILAFGCGPLNKSLKGACGSGGGGGALKKEVVKGACGGGGGGGGGAAWRVWVKAFVGTVSLVILVERALNSGLAAFVSLTGSAIFRGAFFFNFPEDTGGGMGTFAAACRDVVCPCDSHCGDLIWGAGGAFAGGNGGGGGGPPCICFEGKAWGVFFFSNLADFSNTNSSSPTVNVK